MYLDNQSPVGMHRCEEDDHIFDKWHRLRDACSAMIWNWIVFMSPPLNDIYTHSQRSRTEDLKLELPFSGTKLMTFGVWAVCM